MYLKYYIIVGFEIEDQERLKEVIKDLRKKEECGNITIIHGWEVKKEDV